MLNRLGESLVWQTDGWTHR